MFLRRILRKQWTGKKTNIEVMEEAEQTSSWINKIKKNVVFYDQNNSLTTITFIIITILLLLLLLLLIIIIRKNALVYSEE